MAPSVVDHRVGLPIRSVLKTCTRCRIAKPYSDFSLDRGHPRPVCKPCRSLATREYVLANWEKVQEQRRAHNERNREAIQAQRAAFREANRERLAKLQRERHAANPETSRRWREANRERLKELHRLRRSTEDARRRHAENQARRKALQLAAPVVETIDRAYIIKRDRGRCQICGKRPTASELHIDHIVPLSRGGEHSHRNVQVACAACNLKKHAGAANDQLRLVG